ncbi:30S ribosomal protein S1 [Haematococcus lacustris]|uniref:30S ribosomal protein S1 n=1 Tax=Haematococcus lacustris TaxID=44745 RepID=A0A6A0A4V6_HAELA|nr:30S ribosomal protein S1 [Haematococcus lacustris]
MKQLRLLEISKGQDNPWQTPVASLSVGCACAYLLTWSPGLFHFVYQASHAPTPHIPSCHKTGQHIGWHAVRIPASVAVDICMLYFPASTFHATIFTSAQISQVFLKRIILFMMLCNRVSNAQLLQRRVVVSAPFLRPLTCHAAAEATPEAATTSVKIDDLCSGKVTKISPSMAFVTLDNNVPASLHIRMISKKRVEAVGDVFSVGDELKVGMALACWQATCRSTGRRQHGHVLYRQWFAANNGDQDHDQGDRANAILLQLVPTAAGAIDW